MDKDKPQKPIIIIEIVREMRMTPAMLIQMNTREERRKSHIDLIVKPDISKKDK